MRCDFSSDPRSQHRAWQGGFAPIYGQGMKPWRRLASTPGRLLRGLGNVLSCSLFPASCSLCSSPLQKLSEAPVCDACWAEIPAPRAKCCDRCGEDLFEPNSGVVERRHCRACRMAPPAFVQAVSSGVFEGSMRGAIHALKYERIAPVARELGRRLAVAITQLLSDDAPREMLVVPVPLYRSRQGERGFNQARTLASEAIDHLRRTHPGWRFEIALRALVRQRATQSQAGLSPRQRRLNLRGAFFVSDSEAVRGRHILLVDDIYTTGATARTCSRALMDAGAASVRVATVARAQRREPLPVREGIYRRLEIPASAQNEAQAAVF